MKQVTDEKKAKELADQADVAAQVSKLLAVHIFVCA